MTFEKWATSLFQGKRMINHSIISQPFNQRCETRSLILQKRAIVTS
jgi:hypothetical protein